MTQLLLGIFSSLAVIAAATMIATMIRGEWTRIASILSGSELAVARAAGPRVSVRPRGWAPAEPRSAPMMLRAAA